MYVIWYLEKATGTFHKIESKSDDVVLRSVRPGDVGE